MITSIITIKLLGLILFIFLSALATKILQKYNYFKIIIAISILILPFTFTASTNNANQMTPEQRKASIVEYKSFTTWYNNYLKQVDKIDAFNKNYNDLHQLLINDDISFHNAYLKLDNLLDKEKSFNSELLKLMPPPNLTNENLTLVQNIINKTITFSNQQIQLINNSKDLLDEKNLINKKRDEVILEFNKTSILDAPFSLNILAEVAQIKQNIHTAYKPIDKEAK